jgi:CheY-like chemotaxis protein
MLTAPSTQHFPLGHRLATDGVRGDLALAILVVDDEATIRDVAQLALQQQGFIVLQAESGQQALAVYRGDHPQIAGVLLDVRMPGWDGPQTLAALQHIAPGLPCFFMTGFAGEYTEEQLKQRGALGVLAKPFHLAELAACAHQLTGQANKAVPGREAD